jgi:uncharacterized membrane protein YqjE
VVYDFAVLGSSPMLSQTGKTEIRISVFFSLLLLLIALVVGIVVWHPLGWVSSIAVAVVLYVMGILVVVRRLRHRISEADMIATLDNLYEADKEPPKNWYFLP